MRHKRHQVSVPEAEAVIRRSARAVERTEHVALAAAGGRVLAGAVVAALDVPPFDRAAMDGYAVVAADTLAASAGAPALLQCVEDVFAGAVGQPLRDGCCAAVATGAPMPPDADAVVMLERTRRDGRQVQVLAPVAPGEHIGRRGADIQAGQIVGRAGAPLRPGDVGALAAVGIGDVEVYARPRVAVLSTGPELVTPGRPLTSGTIYDVNKHALAALVAAHGGVPRLCRTAADCADDLARALDDCHEDDLIVCSGGTSVGGHDLILEAVARRGTVLFDSIAVKPGKSTGFGTMSGIPVLALPGYPTACLLNAYVLLVPLLRQIARLSAEPSCVRLPLSRRIASPADRHHFSTVRIENGLAVPAFKKAGDVTSVSEADGYISMEPGVAGLDAGTVVDVRLF